MNHRIYAGVFAGALILIILGLGGENENKITGNAVATKLIVLTSENGTCNTTLNTGWNLVSFYCNDEDMSPEGYFASVNASLVSMHAYDPFEEVDKWKAYNPNLPSWVIQDITAVERDAGYWVRMRNSTVHRSNGSLIKPTIIYLKKGWNLAGYPTQYQKNISQSLANNMGPDWVAVYMYNSSDTASPWKIHIRVPPPNTTVDFHNFTPSFGYWIDAGKTGEWYVNY